MRSCSLGLNEGYGRGELQDGEALQHEEDDISADVNAEGIMVASGEPYGDGGGDGDANGGAVGLEITT